MNYIKNEFHSNFTQVNFNAAIAIGLDEHSLIDFPVHKVASQDHSNI